jgi:hypothetical protein
MQAVEIILFKNLVLAGLVQYSFICLCPIISFGIHYCDHVQNPCQTYK